MPKLKKKINYCGMKETTIHLKITREISQFTTRFNFESFQGEGAFFEVLYLLPVRLTVLV